MQVGPTENAPVEGSFTEVRLRQHCAFQVSAAEVGTLQVCPAQVGGAQISPKHANFIVNLGRARAADVKALIDLAQEQVREQFGVELELEIELIGEWNG